MLVRRAACSQLCLGVKIGRNVHTARFKGRKCSYRPLQRAKCSYRPKLDCPRLTTHLHATRLFPPIWTQNVMCTSSDMVAMWLVWIPPSLRSGGYTSHSLQSPPCRPSYTIYYFLLAGYKVDFIALCEQKNPFFDLLVEKNHVRHEKNINFTRVGVTLALFVHQTSNSQNTFFFPSCTTH